MELNHVEHFSLYEYSRFKNKSLKALLVETLEKTMFNDVDFISFLVQSGNLSKSMNELYQAEKKRLIDKQKAREEQAAKEEIERLRLEELEKEETEKLKQEQVEIQELERLKEIEEAKTKEIQAKDLNSEPEVKEENKAETPVKTKKTDKKEPLKNHRMKFLTGITPAKPKEIVKPENPVTVKKKPVKLSVKKAKKTKSIKQNIKVSSPEKLIQPVRVPQQMSILDEVAKVTEREEAQPGKSKKPVKKVKPGLIRKPDNKAKDFKQSKTSDEKELIPFSKRLSNLLKGKEIINIGKSAKAVKPDKSEFGPGSKGVSNSLARKPVKAGKKAKSKKGKKG